MSGTVSNVLVTVDVDYTSFALAGIGMLPVSDNFSAWVKVGIHAYEVDADSGVVQVSDDGSSFLYGLGGNMQFNKQFGAQIEYSRYAFEDDDADFFGGSVIFRF